MFFVYVIKSEFNGFFYVGLTTSVTNRIIQHNKGMTKSTKPFKPWKLFFSEEYETRIEARKREKYLKSGVGKEYIKKYRRPGSSVE